MVSGSYGCMPVSIKRVLCICDLGCLVLYTFYISMLALFFIEYTSLPGCLFRDILYYLLCCATCETFQSVVHQSFRSASVLNGCLSCQDVSVQGGFINFLPASLSFHCLIFRQLTPGDTFSVYPPWFVFRAL